MVIIVMYDLLIVVQVEWIIEIYDGKIVYNLFVQEKKCEQGVDVVVVNMVFGWW